MTGTQRHLTGRIQVALPPAEAFRLFTPRGEQDWAHGWDPRFPAPTSDDTEPGTVFVTSAHGQHTVWLVTDRQPGRRITYARVTPGDQAGTVTVTISGAGHHSEAEVTYQLTALTGTADHKLSEFADGYPAYLRSWQEAITAWIRNSGTGRASCGRVDGRLDVYHRRPVDCLQRVDFDPKPVARHDAGSVEANGVRPIGRAGAHRSGSTREARPRAGSAHRRAPSGPTAPTRSAQHHSSSALGRFSSSEG